MFSIERSIEVRVYNGINSLAKTAWVENRKAYHNYRLLRDSPSTACQYEIEKAEAAWVVAYGYACRLDQEVASQACKIDQLRK